MENNWFWIVGFVILAAVFGQIIGKIAAREKVKRIRKSNYVAEFMVKSAHISRS